MSFTRCIPLLASLMLAIGAAHFWRASLYGFSACAALVAVLAWSHWAWVRHILLLVLPALALRWVWMTVQYVQLRQFMEQPWGRLLVILASVAALTLLAALPLCTAAGRQRYAKGSHAGVQTAVVLLVATVLLPLYGLHPGLFVLERFCPALGSLQIVLALVWGAWLGERLMDTTSLPHLRLRAWQGFSVVFFLQLALGLWGDGRFLLSGTLHLPVPGLILAAPLYRGGGVFMQALFGVSVLLVGAAWCSHLCYFGVWDATAARRTPHGRPLPAWVGHLRWAMLALTIFVPITLRWCGLSWEVGLALALLLGGALLPCMLWWSRRKGYVVYCISLCPLGQAAALLGKLSPWRVRHTSQCTRCGACTRACRYDAMHMRPDGPQPNGRCTLCRDCFAACHHHGLALGLYNSTPNAAWPMQAFVTLVVTLHTLFLAVARV